MVVACLRGGAGLLGICVFMTLWWSRTCILLRIRMLVNLRRDRACLLRVAILVALVALPLTLEILSLPLLSISMMSLIVHRAGAWHRTLHRTRSRSWHLVVWVLLGPGILLVPRMRTWSTMGLARLLLRPSKRIVSCHDGRSRYYTTFRAHLPCSAALDTYYYEENCEEENLQRNLASGLRAVLSPVLRGTAVEARVGWRPSYSLWLRPLLGRLLIPLRVLLVRCLALIAGTRLGTAIWVRPLRLAILLRRILSSGALVYVAVLVGIPRP